MTFLRKKDDQREDMNTFIVWLHIINTEFL